MVSEEKSYVDRTLQQVLNLVQAEPRLLVLDHAFEWY